MKRVIAVDWSGAKVGAKSKMWLAEVCGGRLARLESGRTRHEVIAYLIEVARMNPDLVVGLDFAFSFPLWFAEREGVQPLKRGWNLVAEKGEDWLRECPPPFWGRPGKPKPNLPEDDHYRCTERCAGKAEGANPKSVFQIGGAGAVGTGSIRGMPHLANLAAEGFSIWPFHEVRTPMAIEIYPRLFADSVNKSDFSERRAHLAAECCPEIGGGLACKAASSEDAFDAAVSAVVMSRHIDEIATLTRSQDPVELIEGAIWWPQDTRAAAITSRPMAQSQTDCPFCDISGDAVIDEWGHALAIRDRYPVSCGHTLVVPKAHVKSLFDLDAEAQADIWHLVARVRAELQSRLNPDGFNIGVNDGPAAGQTVNHAHIHVIPRFDGDVVDPRGGIRWILPDRAAYWDQ